MRIGQAVPEWGSVRVGPAVRADPWSRRPVLPGRAQHTEAAGRPARAALLQGLVQVPGDAFGRLGVSPELARAWVLLADDRELDVVWRTAHGLLRADAETHTSVHFLTDKCWSMQNAAKAAVMMVILMMLGVTAQAAQQRMLAWLAKTCPILLPGGGGDPSPIGLCPCDPSWKWGGCAYKSKATGMCEFNKGGDAESCDKLVTMGTAVNAKFCPPTY